MEWESESCTNRVWILAIICATESEVSVVPPPHLFSYLFYFDNKKKTRKQVQQNISNNFIQLSKWEAHYMIVIQSDWNGKLKKIKMRLII